MNLDNVKPYFKFINFAELGDFNAFQDEMYALKNKSIPFLESILNAALKNSQYEFLNKLNNEYNVFTDEMVIKHLLVNQITERNINAIKYLVENNANLKDRDLFLAAAMNLSKPDLKICFELGLDTTEQNLEKIIYQLKNINQISNEIREYLIDFINIKKTQEVLESTYPSIKEIKKVKI